MDKKRRFQNTPLPEELFQKLERLTYENYFGTNRSAYIRTLIEQAWIEYLKKNIVDISKKK